MPCSRFLRVVYPFRMLKELRFPRQKIYRQRVRSGNFRSLVSSGSEPHHYFLQVFRCSTLANIDNQSMTCAIFSYVDALRGHVGIIVMIPMGSSTCIRDKIAEHSFMHSPLYDLSPTTSLFQRSSSSVQGSTSGSGPSGVILFGLISKWDLL